MRSRIFVLLVLASPPAIAEDELDIPGIDSTRLRGDALVWEDATFHLEPWNGGVSFKFVTLSRRSVEVGRAIPVRIVDASMRGFVEVTFPMRSTSTPGCTWRRLEADGRLDALRVFVKREDLAPVLVKPYAAQFPDGTKVKLSPGLPVMPTASGQYSVPVLGDRLRLSIPHASVGYLYKPVQVTDPVAPAKIVRVERNTLARLGELAFTVRGNWLAAVPAKGDPARVSYATRCLEIVAQVPATAVRPGSDFTRAQPVEAPPPPRHGAFVIPRGAPLATQSGRSVAVAAESIEVSDPGTGGACLDLTLRLVREDEAYATQTRQQRLCAARDHVIRTD